MVVGSKLQRAGIRIPVPLAMVAILVLAACAADPVEGPLEESQISSSNSEPNSDAPVEIESKKYDFLYSTAASGPVGIHLEFEVPERQSCEFSEGWSVDSPRNGVYAFTSLESDRGTAIASSGVMHFTSFTASVPGVLEDPGQSGHYTYEPEPSEFTLSGNYSYTAFVEFAAPSPELFGASFFVSLICAEEVVLTRIGESNSGTNWISTSTENGTGVQGGPLGPYVRLASRVELDLTGDRVVGLAWPGIASIGVAVQDNLALTGPNEQWNEDMLVQENRYFAGQPGSWSIETSVVHASYISVGHRGLLMGVHDREALEASVQIPWSARLVS